MKVTVKWEDYYSFKERIISIQTLPRGYNINEIMDIFIKPILRAMGYTEKQVSDYFGEDEGSIQKTP